MARNISEVQSPSTGRVLSLYDVTEIVYDVTEAAYDVIISKY